MNNASLELGGTNWAEKDASLLGYTVSDDSGRFSPQEFTFARGSNLAATRIGKTGLIEKGRENLILQSNQFDTTWVKTISSVTSGHSGYDGSNNAWKLIQNTNTGYHYINQGITNTSIQTFSIYAKAGEYSGISFFIKNLAGNSTASTFNLSTGTFVSNTHNATAESVGNGWYRISLLTKPNGYQTLNVYVNQTTQQSEAGDGTSGIYIQNAQLEQGLAASPYISTTTTTAQAGVLENTPRLNYTTGVANPYLLLEPSRTNLVKYSEYLNGIVWNGEIGVSIGTNKTTSPEGFVNSASIIEDTSNGSHFAYKDFTLTSGTTYTISIYAKKNGTNRNLQFGDGGLGWSSGFTALFNLTAGTATGGTIEPIGNDWYRCSVTGTTNATTCRLIMYPLLGNATSYQGDGTSGVFLYGFQIEQGSYPTSYIPTYSVSATRAVDSCSKTGVSSLINSPEGTMFIDIAALSDDGTNRYLSINDGTTSNYIYFRYVSTSNNMIMRVAIGGVTINTLTYVSPDTTIFSKAALKWKGGDYSFWVDGVERGSNSSATAFGAGVLNEITFGFPTGGGDDFNSKMKQLLVFPTALTDAQLATLTTI